MADKSLQTLERGLDVLMLCAAAERGGVTLTGVMEQLGLTRSTAYRLVKVLRNRGFLRSGGRPGHLELGYQLVQLGKVADTRGDLSDACLPVLHELVGELSETTFVTVRSGWHALCFEQVECSRPVRLSYRKGEQFPLYAGASGKIVMAYMSSHEQEHVLNGELKVFTEPKYVEPKRIRRDLSEIRRQGFAHTAGELDTDAWAICVPILLWDGKFVAGLNVAGPLHRLPADKMETVLACLKDAANRIADRYAKSALRP